MFIYVHIDLYVNRHTCERERTPFFLLKHKNVHQCHVRIF